MRERVLAVVGAGGHGFVVAEAALAQGRWSSVVFFDDDVAAHRDLRGFAFGGSVDALTALGRGPARPEVIVAIGRNELRLELGRRLEAAGFELATVIHPSAVISPSVSLGRGTVALAGSVVNGRTRVGQACILNTRCSIDHDNRIGDGVHVSPGASLAGGVTVGDCAWIGIGASVIQGVDVGTHARIGAGSAVISAIPAYATAVGCPARSKPGRRDVQEGPVTGPAAD